MPIVITRDSRKSHAREVHDELRQAEAIDETGENEPGDKPEDWHLADVVRVTETGRKQRQGGAEGSDEQAAQDPPDRQRFRRRFIEKLCGA
jgi:hypothetical protein